MFLKVRYRLGYESLCAEVADSISWRRFACIGLDGKVPHPTARSQAKAILAADFFETVTLTGTRMHILAVIEHASRRVRILGATANPTTGWVRDCCVQRVRPDQAG